MKRFASILLAGSSLLFGGICFAATRPHYGGTLHVSMRAAPTSLDPATQSDSLASRNLSRLVFDTLVSLDDRGLPQPALATSWGFNTNGQSLRWQLVLRHGVTFSDGTPLTADAAAASLRVSNPAWKISSAADAVIIDSPSSNLPAELALSRNSIVKRDGGKLLGTGPFVVTQWDPGRKLVLAARDDSWAGRPFVDTIEVELGKNFRDQMMSLDLGRSDLVEVPPEQEHRASAEGRQIDASAPLELMALVFARDPATPEEARAREMLALSIDRSLLNNVLMQGGGEPTGALLPTWMTGYGFVFTADTNVARAKQIRSEIHQLPTWTIAYSPTDTISRVVAERIALNAGDVGLALQLTTIDSASIRIMRLPMPSLDSSVALARLAMTLGLPQTKPTSSSEDLYAAENGLLQTQRVIPLLHLRPAFGIRPTVKGMAASRDGTWHLEDAWLGTDKP